MPASAKAATVIFLSLPTTILLGLDTLAITPSAQFLGVTEVPAGWHFVYAGAHAALSIRSGYWFYVPPDFSAGNSQTWLRIFRWSNDNETLESVDDITQLREWKDRLSDTSNQEVHRRLLPYDFDPSSSDANAPPREAVDLGPLTGYISAQLLNHITASSYDVEDGLWMLSTSSSSPEDRDDIPGLSTSERHFTRGGGSNAGAVLGEERELHFLDIDLRRTWRADAVGRERTNDARDRSAALERVLGAWANEEDGEDALLGDLQVCFFAVLLLANWSALQEWKRVLELALTCRRRVSLRPRFFAALLATLQAQLERCDDVEGGLFDVQGEGAAFLKRHLQTFRETLRSLADEQDGKTISQVQRQMDGIERWVADHWGWILDRGGLPRRGFVELEDGEQVEVEMEGFDAEDETGEYAPVIVDLDEGHA